MNTHHIILTNSPIGILRMLPYDEQCGLTLEDWTPQGLHEVTLPPEAVQALLRQLPAWLLGDALEAQGYTDVRVSGSATAPESPSPVWHWEVRLDVPACGRYLLGQGLTPSPQDMTCPACLDVWREHCQHVDDAEPLELRTAYAGRPGLGTLPWPGKE